MATRISTAFSTSRLRGGGTDTILLAFVVLDLLLLSVTPLLFEQAIRPHREYIEDVVQPARESIREIESRLTEEVALSRGYLLTRDEGLLEDYRRVQEEQRASLARLGSRAAELQRPDLRRQVRVLQRLVVERHEPVAELRRGEITPEEYVGRLSARQELLATTAATARNLAADLISSERAEREEIRTLRRYQDRTLVVLVLLTILAVIAIGWVAVRLRQRTREEEALRRIASAMNAALGVDQIARWIAGNALFLVGADAVIVERADPETNEAETVATSGREIRTPRSPVPFPGALAPGQVERGGSRQFARLADEQTPTGSFLAERYPTFSGAVFPLMSDWGAMGSLVALREPGRPRLSHAEMHRGDMLADLAALAMRKILLLERSQTGWERAEHLLESRSRLIRGLSHDLRNPLGAILGFTQILDSGLEGELPEQQREYVRRIQAAAESMDGMIQHLVEVGRSDTAEAPFHRRVIAVQELVREVSEEHRGRADQAGLELVVDVAEDLPTIQSDPVHIRTVLGNLLSNAVKYTPRGRVDVRAGTRSDPGGPEWIAIEVRDTGPGIAPEDQETVFEEFSRLRAEDAPGEGIGLANSRRVARRLAGELKLESAPGRGSTFVLLLPVHTNEEPPVPPSPDS